MKVIPGPASAELGRKIAIELGVEALTVHHKLFPDGESYIRLDGSVKGEKVLIVQTTSHPQDTRLIQLLQLTATAKDYGAEKITCCVPYLAYSRQDKRFLEGEAESLKIVLKLIESTGVDDLIVIDIHNEESLKRWEGVMQIWNLSATPIIADHLKKMGLYGAYSLGPDKGAIRLVKMADNVLKGGYGFFEKERDRITGGIQMTIKEVDVGGRDVIVFDDIISSGGTMAKAVSLLRSHGARRIVAACTHGLLTGDAERLITNAGAEFIIATDSVPSKFSSVSVAPIVAQHLRKIGY
ncbi:ribose-phosphate diphosphokinase [Candidatus Bathyarchaeota archaeon]|nr:ribose-phosphate diphosphokinase [Candidatus Bathyarchaeota archaeon]